MQESFIAAAVRTPIGNLNGALSSVSATDLGSCVIEEAVRRTGIEPRKIDEVIMGNVLSGGLGQAPGRQAAKGAGLPDSVDATTINKLCGSGLKALKAQKNGWFLDEIVPVEIPGKSEPQRVLQDERLKRFDEAKLRGLPPAFEQEGTVTAGNASGINDGAAAMVIVAEERLRSLN